MITVKFVFSLLIAKNNEFYKTKKVFCSVFPSSSDETIVRVKRSSGVILAIFGHFSKIEKARIRATSWTDIGCAWTPLSIFKNLARWHPVQKKYSRLQFNGYHATYMI